LAGWNDQRLEAAEDLLVAEFSRIGPQLPAEATEPARSDRLSGKGR
jgi:hypothetical protein